MLLQHFEPGNLRAAEFRDHVGALGILEPRTPQRALEVGAGLRHTDEVRGAVPHRIACGGTSINVVHVSTLRLA
ncbi:MAG: hypothetical protein NVSMB26_21350 [Beijerinckiaceae bacterium]